MKNIPELILWGACLILGCINPLHRFAIIPWLTFCRWFKVCVWQDCLCRVSLAAWMSFGSQQKSRLLMLIWFSQSSHLNVHLFLCGESCYNDLICRSGPGSVRYCANMRQFLSQKSWKALSLCSTVTNENIFDYSKWTPKLPIVFENKIHNILVKGKQAWKIVRWNLRSQLGEKRKGCCLSLLKPRWE